MSSNRLRFSGDGKAELDTLCNVLLVCSDAIVYSAMLPDFRWLNAVGSQRGERGTDGFCPVLHSTVSPASCGIL